MTLQNDRESKTILQDELHWLTVNERIDVMVYWCLHWHLGTFTSSQPLMLLLAVFVYDPLTRIVSMFLAADIARTAVGLHITLARQSGTRCQMNLETTNLYSP